MYIYISMYIYIEKKNAKERNVLHSFTFFCIRTLCSFTFFAKEHCALGVILCSLQKNVAFFAFFYILKKGTQKSATIFCGLISRQKLEKIT